MMTVSLVTTSTEISREGVVTGTVGPVLRRTLMLVPPHIMGVGEETVALTALPMPSPGTPPDRPWQMSYRAPDTVSIIIV